ncbi:Crp/Fnr family transcriptional regulator [Inquilinus sp.]|jgi:CRP-like cAMP-binding protein|uniref:Crp/Fnr family transcriptional regulator n=1 Tax=Inquilinus sp. TaxID=1932117 RepID=UPI0037838694
MELKGSPLIERLRLSGPLSEEDIRVAAILQRNTKRYPARTDFPRTTGDQNALHIIVHGWACTFKDLQDGSRQVIDVLIPGDIAGLRTGLLTSPGQSFGTISEVVAAEISSHAILRLFEQWPRIGSSLLWAAGQDSAILAERLVDIGRRSATARIAHFLLELGARLQVIGQATHRGFPCPLTQHDLANALGLTAIHVNRVLRELREQNLLAFRNAEVEFLDRKRLATLAQFDPSYLNHRPTGGTPFADPQEPEEPDASAPPSPRPTTSSHNRPNARRANRNSD